MNQIRTTQKTTGFTVRDCSRCGRKDHKATDDNCPAKNQKCKKCGYTGHFERKCRTKTKRKFFNGKNREDTKRFKTEVNAVHAEEENDITEEYVFHLDAEVDLSCKIGGVETKMIVDSGSKHNIIGYETWLLMKTKGVKV